MSFAVPKNAPSFNNPQRELENRVWGSSGAVYGRHHAPHTGPGHKFGSFFERPELPMYKDKPYYGVASRRRRWWWWRRRVLVGALLLFAGLLYWFGGIAPSRPGDSAPRKGDSGRFGWLSGGRGSKIDWEARREKVREAFILSWDAYEQHAWGMLPQEICLLG